VIQKRHNLFLIPVVLIILAATALSVMSAQKQAKKMPAAVPQAASEQQKTAPPAPAAVQGDVFFEKLYEERLKEEGNRTKIVEELIRKGVLSDKPARYVKEAKGNSK
jgi:hypothetical protein